jgi:hypothetical protein
MRACCIQLSVLKESGKTSTSNSCKADAPAQSYILDRDTTCKVGGDSDKLVMLVALMVQTAGVSDFTPTYLPW